MILNGHARYWIVGMLLLGTAVGCDNGTPQEPAVPPESERLAEVAAPITDQMSSPKALPATQPGSAISKGQPLPSKTETKAEAPDSERQIVKVKAAGIDGVTSRATELKAAPQVDGQTIRALSAATRLLIFERQGGWYRVSTGDNEGWLRMLHVTRTAVSGDASVGAELATLAALATGREGMGNVAATTGIRGLSEEALETAEPDMARLQALDGHGVTRAEAAEAAGREGLNSRTIAYLKEPEK